MKVQQLSDVPYMGTPYSAWYIEYNQAEKTVKLDGQEVSSRVAFDIIKSIKEQLLIAPEQGHHYDVLRNGDIIRIGMSGHNVEISHCDIPCL